MFNSIVYLPFKGNKCGYQHYLKINLDGEDIEGGIKDKRCSKVSLPRACLLLILAFLYWFEVLMLFIRRGPATSSWVGADFAAEVKEF